MSSQWMLWMTVLPGVAVACPLLWYLTSGPRRKIAAIIASVVVWCGIGAATSITFSTLLFLSTGILVYGASLHSFMVESTDPDASFETHDYVFNVLGVITPVAFIVVSVIDHRWLVGAPLALILTGLAAVAGRYLGREIVADLASEREIKLETERREEQARMQAEALRQQQLDNERRAAEREAERRERELQADRRKREEERATAEKRERERRARWEAAAKERKAAAERQEKEDLRRREYERLKAMSTDQGDSLEKARRVELVFERAEFRARDNDVLFALYRESSGGSQKWVVPIRVLSEHLNLADGETMSSLLRLYKRKLVDTVDPPFPQNTFETYPEKYAAWPKWHGYRLLLTKRGIHVAEKSEDEPPSGQSPDNIIHIGTSYGPVASTNSIIVSQIHNGMAAGEVEDLIQAMRQVSRTLPAVQAAVLEDEIDGLRHGGTPDRSTIERIRARSEMLAGVGEPIVAAAVRLGHSLGWW